jgi:hypothetical protein
MFVVVDVWIMSFFPPKPQTLLYTAGSFNDWSTAFELCQWVKARQGVYTSDDAHRDARDGQYVDSVVVYVPPFDTRFPKEHPLYTPPRIVTF